MNAKEIIGLDPQSGRCLRVHINGQQISGIEETGDACEWMLAPGLIDLQVNGAFGLDVNADDVTTDVVLQLAEHMLHRGVTCFVPTLISAREEKICHGLAVIAQARKQSGRAAACIPYVHIEGPYISPRVGYRGAHDAAVVRPPSIAEFERWRAAAEGMVGMVTLSPHYAEAPAFIARVSACGVHVAIGHTHADSEQIRRAVDAGARLSTHLGNGLASEIPRHRNPLWSQLVDDRLSASVIADGHHLPKEILEVILRAKGKSRVLLVSDSVALAGMPAGEYEAPVGGRVTLREDGRLCVADTELLAGSTACLADCVSGMMKLTGLSLSEVLPMATSQPGRFVGGRGHLEVGAYADLLRFRIGEGIEIDAVWLRGEQAHARTA